MEDNMRMLSNLGRTVLQEAAVPSASPPEPDKEPDIVEVYSFNTGECLSFSDIFCKTSSQNGD